MGDYGFSIDGLNISNPRFGFLKEISSRDFVRCDIQHELKTFLEYPTGELKQYTFPKELNYKVFFRKKTPFSFRATTIYSGLDSGYSAIFSEECCFLLSHKDKVYILCRFPDLFEFKIFSSYREIKRNNKYGIEIYNEQGVLTFHSDSQPMMLSYLYKLTDIIPLTTVCNLPSGVAGYSVYNLSPSIFYSNMMRLDTKNVKKENKFIELGCMLSLSEKIPNQKGDEISGFYTICIDSSGNIAPILNIGFFWGINKMLLRYHNYPSRVNVKLYSNSLYVALF
ncbi:hypothetical protein [Actinobacillus porcinus]|uniref:hypothetical protein n=1 Tax=Actinobacillus porcinus TaxID=51048 RepID=UPI0023F2241E|nr:hypothetical protein [Actinobacillus porcinus]MDD7545015.1 hypothetical protein [Actinobacillus porcinus]MDY5847647.1 hypothetical protein [Actinobacillus porcinus]